MYASDVVTYIRGCSHCVSFVAHSGACVCPYVSVAVSCMCARVSTYVYKANAIASVPGAHNE